MGYVGHQRSEVSTDFKNGFQAPQDGTSLFHACGKMGRKRNKLWEKGRMDEW